MTHLRKPPGPRSLPLVGNLYSFRRDPNGFLLMLARRYGDIARFKLGPRDAFLLNHPDLVKDVLVTHPADFAKGRLMQRAKRLFGEGLLTSAGDAHRRQRRRIQPAFHRQRIAGYGGVMTAFAARLSDRWEQGSTRCVSQEMTRLSMAVVAKTLFDADIEDEEEELGQALRVLCRWFPLLTLPGAELLERLPIPPLRAVRAAFDCLEETIGRVIEDRRAAGRSDVASMLLEAHGEDGCMSEARVRDELMTLFLAGHETTATALTWTWYLLSQHPPIEARLHGELDSLLGGRLPTAEDIPRLEYTRMVFAESLRLYPPVGRMGRRPLQDYPVRGQVIPAGSVLFLSPYVMHRDPRYFPEPERFDPERWRSERKSSRPTYSYFPFGGGPRLCIGEQFSKMTAMLTIATIAQRWRLRLVPGHPVQTQSLLTLRPRYGMRMSLVRRDPAAGIAWS